MCATLLLCATCHAESVTVQYPHRRFSRRARLHRISSPFSEGLNICAARPQETIDPDFAGIRSSLAALGIGYIGYTNNNFYDNTLPRNDDIWTQTYNGQKPTFSTNNVMQLTYDLSRYGSPTGKSCLAASTIPTPGHPAARMH